MSEINLVDIGNSIHKSIVVMDDMTDFFKGRRIWITGASSGIGEALAIQLAERGAQLILSARRVEVLESLRQRLSNPDQHQVIVLDLAQPEMLFKQVQAHIASGLKLDILINNAGISQRGLAQNTALAVDRMLMEVNYLGTVAMTKAVLPALLKEQGAIVATVASVAGLVGSQGRSSYSATKHALMGFMESLRAELYTHGVQVTVACPGWVKTQISINALDEVGAPLGTMDPTIAQGIPAELCAAQFLNAIEKGKAQVVIGRGFSVLAPIIKRFFPGWYRRINSKQVYR